jgi:hypothetical protein
MDGFTPELRINKQLAPLVFETLKINQTFPTKTELHVLPSKSPKNGLMMANQSLISMDRSDLRSFDVAALDKRLQ